MTTEIETPTIDIRVRLFGAFRQFAEGPAMALTVPAGGSVADVRKAFAARFQGNDNALALLKASAFATDQSVLDDDDALPDAELSVLPPVCGG
jgi:molybdopterin converting factor small subunit